jgi:hypothetical protein
VPKEQSRQSFKEIHKSVDEWVDLAMTLFQFYFSFLFLRKLMQRQSQTPFDLIAFYILCKSLQHTKQWLEKLSSTMPNYKPEKEGKTQELTMSLDSG